MLDFQTCPHQLKIISDFDAKHASSDFYISRFCSFYEIVDETMNMTHLLRYVVRFSSIHFLRVNFPFHMSPV